MVKQTEVRSLIMCYT